MIWEIILRDSGGTILRARAEGNPTPADALWPCQAGYSLTKAVSIPHKTRLLHLTRSIRGREQSARRVSRTEPTLKLSAQYRLKSLTGLRHVYGMLRESGLHGENREHSGDAAPRAGSDPHKLALGFKRLAARPATVYSSDAE